MKNLGRRIKELRIARGWSQEELAERVGVNRANVSHYERGRNKEIPSDMLKRFADTLGVSSDYLLGKSDDEEQPQSEFIRRLDLADDPLDDIVLVLDGKELTSEEARTVIAFLRTRRELSK